MLLLFRNGSFHREHGYKNGSPTPLYYPLIRYSVFYARLTRTHTPEKPASTLREAGVGA